jgi:hypothetical protein
MSGFNPLAGVQFGSNGLPTGFSTAPSSAPLSATSTPALSIGGYTFQDNEHPVNLSFGLESKLVVDEFPGGGRQVQNLGPQPKEVTWKGTFWDAGAEATAAGFKRMQAAGNPVTLTWNDQSYSVYIKEFTPNYLYVGRVEYTFTVTVIADLSGNFSTAAGASLDSQTKALYANAQAALNASLSFTSGNGASSLPTSVATGVNNVGTALNNAGPLAQASSGSIASIQQAVNSTLTQVQAYQATINSAIDALPSGIIPSSLQQQYSNISSLLTNLALINVNVGNGQPPQTYSTGGGVTAFHIASQVYGDATLAGKIMAANGLISSTLPPGSYTLKIPPAQSNGLQ